MRILALCLAAALTCASLRSAHPQIAAAVALAAGVGALTLSLEPLSALAGALGQLDALSAQTGAGQLPLVKLCGVALTAEFASDICRDAGETALARRIETGVRIGIAAAALPLASEILGGIAALLA